MKRRNILKSVGVLTCVSALFFFSVPVQAKEQATPQDVYDLVLKAYSVIEQLGDDALPEFNKPKGEFVYKDTYVFVLECPKYMAAHPFAIDKLKGMDLQAKYPFQITLCEGGASPDGKWVEYDWPKPGTTEDARKISFTIRVKGTPYTVVAGIYNEDVTLKELEKTMR